MTDEKQTQEQADEEMINQGFQELLDSYLATKHRKKVEIITKSQLGFKLQPIGNILIFFYLRPPFLCNFLPKLLSMELLAASSLALFF